MGEMGEGGEMGEVDADGLGDGDGEAVGDAGAAGDFVAVAVADGVRPADVAGEATVTTTGTMAGAGSGPGEAGDSAEPDAADLVPETTGRIAVALGTACAADECLAAPGGARVNTTDAARTLAVAPAAASGRHRRRDETRPDGRASPEAVVTAGFGEMYWANAHRGQSAAGRTAPASASTSSAVGRSRGSLARQRPTSGRSWAGSRSRLGGL